MAKKDKKGAKEESQNDSSNVEGEKSPEPAWYHYLIVLVVLGIIFVGVPYYIYNFTEDEETGPNISRDIYNYEYKQGNITYNLKFDNTLEQINSMQAPIQLKPYHVLNTVDIKYSFMDYNGTDNGKVTRVSTKLKNFLKLVYHFQFDDNDVHRYSNLNCTNSTHEKRVVVFNPYANKTGVYLDNDNGCVRILSSNVSNYVLLGDKLLYSLTKK